MNRRLYAIHRWFSAIALVQLTIWVGSGFFFAITPMKRVKGTPVDAAVALAPDLAVVPIEAVLRNLARQGSVERVELVGTPRGPMYRCKVDGRRLRVDARSGQDSPVSSDEAEEIARRDQPGQPPVRAVVRIEKDAQVEYRGKPLPAWRVQLADEAGTAVYIDAATGEVTARRNDVWRLWDFLWSLHIMDYGERETFNHPLLIGAAALGALTVLSGVVLWSVRIVRWLRRSGGIRPSVTASSVRS